MIAVRLVTVILVMVVPILCMPAGFTGSMVLFAVGLIGMMRVVSVMGGMAPTMTFVKMLGLLKGMRITRAKTQDKDRNRDGEKKRLHYS